MLDISEFVHNIDAADARAAIYYVSRYLKQASMFEEYGKDIFEEEERSAPGESVRALAVKIIGAIELHERSRIADLNDERIVELLDYVTSLERDVGASPSDSDLSAAAAFTASIDIPPITK